MILEDGQEQEAFYHVQVQEHAGNGLGKERVEPGQDSRKPRFGSLIRKLSLDELPQFWNMLKGDMSVIGPRPQVTYHVEHFKKEVPRYLVWQHRTSRDYRLGAGKGHAVRYKY